MIYYGKSGSNEWKGEGWYRNEGIDLAKRLIQESSVGVGFLGLSEGNR